MKTVSQEEVRKSMLRTNYLVRYHKDSPFKSLGQVLSFLYVYAGYQCMEDVTVGGNEVRRWGKKIADLTWDEEKEIPIFEFVMPDYKFAQDRQTVFLNNYEEITKPYEK